MAVVVVGGLVGFVEWFVWCTPFLELCCCWSLMMRTREELGAHFELWRVPWSICYVGGKLDAYLQ